MKPLKNYVLLLSLIICASIISSCNGGGGGTSNTSPLTVTLINPSNAGKIDLTTVIKVKFNKIVTNVTPNSIKLKDGNGSLLAVDVAKDKSYSVTNILYDITPVKNLYYNSTYTLTLTNDITDVYGVKLQQSIFNFWTDSSINSILHSFKNNGLDGMLPTSTLLIGSDGSLYGTTTEGGSYNAGTVFSISPNGTETVLYSFSGNLDGNMPEAGLIQGSDGSLYGTTEFGGEARRGNVFKVTLTGIETTLYSFGGGHDGGVPMSELINGADGNFYGTTAGGGDNDNGVVFKLTPDGHETVLHSFGSSVNDGATPTASLIQGSDGSFYGTTQYGGLYNDGIVFKITSNGIETVLHSFGGSVSDGAAPTCGLVQGSDGDLYGTTYNGGIYNGGTIFRITTSGVETILHAFASNALAGANPNKLIQGSDGNFYGTTLWGGIANRGTVYKITPSGQKTVIYSFGSIANDGGAPEAGLVQDSNGNLYGTTWKGGDSGVGTVFKINIAKQQ